MESYLSIILALLTLGLGIWLIPLYRKLHENEKLIREKEDQIDGVEPDVNARTSGHTVNEKQRLAQLNVAKKPLERELERLKQERQFIIDKLPFFKR
jgi:hypothetical protein